jgi:hypothetical protein
MGGQACVLYGAAEFSRDTDLALHSSPQNFSRLRQALRDLDAHVIALPPFEPAYLRRGHAVHFRCRHPDANGLHVDVMTRMRGVAPFSRLWVRRTSLELPGGLTCEVMGLPDLVQAKKTQRDKDWPMVRRLVEAHYFQHRHHGGRAQVRFWLRELRTPQLLVEVAQQWPELWRVERARRGLLEQALPGRERRLAAALLREERAERQADARYWQPLRAELERLRRARQAGTGRAPEVRRARPR